MTTKSKNEPVHTGLCPLGHEGWNIMQAKGSRAYLYARCPVCGFDQRPDNPAAQRELWEHLPEAVRASIRRPALVAPDPAPAPAPILEPEPEKTPAPAPVVPATPTTIMPKPGRRFGALLAVLALLGVIIV